MNPMASSLLDDDQLSPTSPDSGAFAAAPAPATTLEVSRSLPSLRVCIVALNTHRCFCRCACPLTHVLACGSVRLVLC